MKIPNMRITKRLPVIPEQKFSTNISDGDAWDWEEYRNKVMELDREFVPLHDRWFEVWESDLSDEQCKAILEPTDLELNKWFAEEKQLMREFVRPLSAEAQTWLGSRNDRIDAEDEADARRIQAMDEARAEMELSVKATVATPVSTTAKPLNTNELTTTAQAIHVRARTIARISKQTGKSVIEIKRSMKAALRQAKGKGLSPDAALQAYWNQKDIK